MHCSATVFAGSVEESKTDVSKAADWNFPDASLNFFELYNVTDDHFMLRNIYVSADQELKDRLHAQLKAQFNCRGQAECR